MRGRYDGVQVISESVFLRAAYLIEDVAEGLSNRILAAHSMKHAAVVLNTLPFASKLVLLSPWFTGTYGDPLYSDILKQWVPLV